MILIATASSLLQSACSASPGDLREIEKAKKAPLPSNIYPSDLAEQDRVNGCIHFQKICKWP